jgi:GNAT superfamily N-acetyltransferase
MEFMLTVIDILALDFLTVDPKHQRRGAGRMLVQWGTKKADELGFTVRSHFLIHIGARTSMIYISMN